MPKICATERPYSLGLYEKAMPNPLTLPEKLVMAKECGFDFVELSIDETDEKLARLHWSGAERLELHRAMLDAGMRFRSMCLSAHRKYPLGGESNECLAIMRDAITLAAELGIRLIQLAGYDVYYTPSTGETALKFEKNLALCVEMAAAHEITLAFETMETPFMDTVGKAMRYIELIGSPWLQIYPDLGNITNAAKLYGTSVRDDLLGGQGHIAALHLKESAPGVYRDRPYGTGHVDFAEAIELAAEMGVRSFVGEFWYDGITEPREYLRAAKAFLDT